MNRTDSPLIQRKETGSEKLSLLTRKDVPYLAFPSFDKKGAVRHAFSTRQGGVSAGAFCSMNLSFTRGDDDTAVLENFRRMAHVLGKQPEDVVCTFQTHTTNIRIVTSSDRGKGVVRERDYRDIDGLLTDDPSVVLSCFMADCVPLLFADPVRRVIGAAHAGWRGSVSGMAHCMIRAMHDTYGSDPSDIFTAIGPSICGDCYEVGADVGECVREALSDLSVHDDARIGPGKDGAIPAEEVILRTSRRPGKFLLDLHALNRAILLAEGVLPEHLFVTDICTRCNPELLFSHRVQGEARGSLAAFIRLAQ